MVQGWKMTGYFVRSHWNDFRIRAISLPPLGPPNNGSLCKLKTVVCTPTRLNYKQSIEHEKRHVRRDHLQARPNVMSRPIDAVFRQAILYAISQPSSCRLACERRAWGALSSGESCAWGEIFTYSAWADQLKPSRRVYGRDTALSAILRAIFPGQSRWHW